MTTTRRQRSDGARSRETILRAAANLATTEGLEGLSIGSLADRIGMSKSGLYAHFGSKEELQLATVETAEAIFTAEVVEPTAAIADSIQRLLALTDTFIDHLERRVFQGGCFFAATWTEFATRPGRVKDRIVEVQQGWMALLTGLIVEAQAAGALREDEDAGQLAFEIESYLLMGNTSFVATDDSTHLHRARAAVVRRLELATSR